MRGFHIVPGIGAACIEQAAELFEQGPAQAYHVEVLKTSDMHGSFSLRLDGAIGKTMS